jgi:EmrB/QacA subfamily drug resistance transporter
MSAEPTQKAGSPTGTPGAGNGKSVNKAPDSAYKTGSPTATPGASANGRSASPAARSNGKSANPTTRSSGKSANKAPDSAYNDKAGQGGIAYKWLVVMVVVFGIFMSVLDATVVAVALPKLQAVFGATLNQIQWVVTGYLLAFAVIIPLVGYLADRFGIKRIYMTALVVFTGGSILCGLAWNTNSLIFFRILQGLGGGGLLPLATAMIYAAFPPQERGLASATLGVPVLLAPALGPTLGGYIVQYADWRLIFYLNVPIGIAGFLMALFLLRERLSPNPGSFDLPGFVLSTIGFGTLLYGITDSTTDGWTSSTVLFFVASGIVSLLGFIYVELTSESPLLDLRLFKDWSFLSGNMITWILQISFFGALFLVSLFLQELRGLGPFETGLWLLPEALVTVFILPIGGILVDRIGAKWIILVGVTALTLASFGLAHLNLYMTYLGLQSVLVIRSVALAFTLQPASVVALYNVPRNALPRASALLRVLAQVAGSFGTATLTTYLQDRVPLHFAHLAEQATISSSAATFVAQITQDLEAHGYNVQAAHTGALQILAQNLQQQATVLAFDDTYLLAASIAAIGIFIAFFLRGRPKAAKEGSQSGSSKQEIEARKAALAESLL